jgi:hypothetical protein
VSLVNACFRGAGDPTHRQVGDMYNRTRLTPKVKKLFAAWLRWNR